MAWRRTKVEGSGQLHQLSDALTALKGKLTEQAERTREKIAELKALRSEQEAARGK